MSNFEFLKYEPTPGERHLGIASVKLYGKIILRYKIIPKTDGSGFFPAAASYKLPANGEKSEHYISAFMLDSLSDKDEIESLIRARVAIEIANHKAQLSYGNGGAFPCENKHVQQPTTHPPSANQQNAGQQNTQQQSFPGFEQKSPTSHQPWGQPPPLPPIPDGMPF